MSHAFGICVSLHWEFAYLSRCKSIEDDACCYAFSTCIAHCFPLVMVWHVESRKTKDWETVCDRSSWWCWLIHEARWTEYFGDLSCLLSSMKDFLDFKSAYGLHVSLVNSSIVTMNPGKSIKRRLQFLGKTLKLVDHGWILVPISIVCSPACVCKLHHLSYDLMQNTFGFGGNWHCHNLYEPITKFAWFLEQCNVKTSWL
jgi:hypothetical protein